MRNFLAAGAAAMMLMAFAPVASANTVSPQAALEQRVDAPCGPNTKRARMAEIGRAFASGKHGATALWTSEERRVARQTGILQASLRFANGGRPV